MKKARFTLVPFTIALLLSACTKEDEAGMPPCFWKVGNITHNGELATRQNTTALKSEGKDGRYCIIYFSTLPTSAPDEGAEYKIVNFTRINSLAANECVVQVNNSATDMLMSTGYEGKTANIKVDHDKITVLARDAYGRHVTNSGMQSDSTTIGAFITER